MTMERTGWAAASGTLYKMRDGRTVKITGYNVCYFAPGSSGATNYRAGINEFILGVLIRAGKDNPEGSQETFEWNEQGICVEHMAEVLADEPPPGYKKGEFRTGDSNPAYDLVEAVRGGAK